MGKLQAFERLPAIDISDIVQALKREGCQEVGKALESSSKQPFWMHDWNALISILEKEVAPLLASGCEVGALVPAAKKMAGIAGRLSFNISQVLSFVPGPIGIVCSLVNAVVYFSMGNIPEAFMELLGCIPGVKMGIKGSALFTKVGVLTEKALKKNPAFIQSMKKVEKVKGDISPSGIQREMARLQRQVDMTTEAMAAESKMTREIGYDFLNVTSHSSSKINAKGVNMEKFDLQARYSIEDTARRIPYSGTIVTDYRGVLTRPSMGI